MLGTINAMERRYAEAAAEFRLGDQSHVRSIGGVTMGLDSLPLVWSVQ